MTRQSIYISAISGCITASIVCLFFFLWIYKPSQPDAIKPPKIEKEQVAGPVSSPQIPNSEITQLTLTTSYRGFFEKDSKCSQSYNELYKNDDGYYNSGSPCRLTLSFNQDGTATKSLESYRYNKALKKTRVTEKSVWTTRIKDDQFKELAEYIGNDKRFKNYENISVNIVNSTVTVNYKNEVRTVEINADESRPLSLEMMNAFKKLASEIDWEKVQ